MNIIFVLLIGIICGFFLGQFALGNVLKKEIESLNRKISEQKLFRELLLEWTNRKINLHELSAYFMKNQYKKIAIYGMGDLGECFYNEMRKTDIIIDYVVDRNAKNIIVDVPSYTLEDELPEVDVVVVTPIQYYSSIKKDLSTKCKCPIVSLEDVVFDKWD